MYFAYRSLREFLLATDGLELPIAVIEQSSKDNYFNFENRLYSSKAVGSIAMAAVLFDASKDGFRAAATFGTMG